MTITEKLTTIAQNMPKVYDAGKAEGGRSEYDRFWDAYQENGNRQNYNYAFAGWGWNDNTFQPKHPIVGSGQSHSSCDYIFSHSKVSRVDMDFSGFKRITYILYGNQATTWVNVIDLKSANNVEGLFHSAVVLETIERLVSYEHTPWIGNCFQNATNLTNIALDGVIAASINFRWSPLLTDASVQSIIDHLKDLTGATAQTLSFHADVGAKLTDAQKATITAKNWTLVY